MAWYVYIVECSDRTYYTGTTNNIEQRIKQHNSGKGAKYTRGRGPVKLIYKLRYKTRAEACKQEYAIKQYSKARKMKLIKGPSA